MRTALSASLVSSRIEVKGIAMASPSIYIHYAVNIYNVSSVESPFLPLLGTTSFPLFDRKSSEEQEQKNRPRLFSGAARP
jgi:hypothetical protein